MQDENYPENYSSGYCYFQIQSIHAAVVQSIFDSVEIVSEI